MSRQMSPVFNAIFAGTAVAACGFLPVQASAAVLLAADNSKGGSVVAEFDATTLLEGKSMVVGPTITGLTEDPTGIYVATGPLITRYSVGGSGVASIREATGVSFDALSASGGLIYAGNNLAATDRHSIAIFAPALTQTVNDFSVQGTITGLSVGASGIYVANGPLLTKYDQGGAAVSSIRGANGVSFDALANDGTDIVAADNLASSGVHAIAFFDPTLTTTVADFAVPDTITGLAADATDVYVAMGSRIVEYSLSGQVVGQFTGRPGDDFTALTIAPDLNVAVPEPASIGVLLSGLGVLAGLRRRVRGGGGRSDAWLAARRRPRSAEPAAAFDDFGCCLARGG